MYKKKMMFANSASEVSKNINMVFIGYYKCNVFVQWSEWTEN